MIRQSIRTYYAWNRPQFAQLAADGMGALTSGEALALAHRSRGTSVNTTTSTTANSNNSTNSTTRDDLAQLVRRNFQNVDFAFGYGSGVVKQAGYGSSDKPQVDLIFGTSPNSANWHARNIQLNPGHYSGLKYGGARLVLGFQDLGAGVYFNPYVSIEGQIVKYGVSTTANIVKDLCEWNSLYIGGRLQKPVEILLGADNEFIRMAYEYNLQLAINLGVLMIKTGSKGRDGGEKTIHDLFEVITSLSYVGDIRMVIGGENPNKIKNIVHKQFDRFYRLYEPYIRQLQEAEIIDSNGKITSTPFSEEDIYNAISGLPKTFRATFHLGSGTMDYSNVNSRLFDTIRSIVRYPSVVQMVKGGLTAGVLKSAKYAWEKKKKLRS